MVIDDTAKSARSHAYMDKFARHELVTNGSLATTYVLFQDMTLLITFDKRMNFLWYQAAYVVVVLELMA